MCAVEWGFLQNVLEQGSSHMVDAYNVVNHRGKMIWILYKVKYSGILQLLKLLRNGCVISVYSKIYSVKSAKISL